MPCSPEINLQETSAQQEPLEVKSHSQYMDMTPYHVTVIYLYSVIVPPFRQDGKEHGAPYRLNVPGEARMSL